MKNKNPIQWEINRWKDEENPKTALKREYKALNLFEKANLKGIGKIESQEKKLRGKRGHKI